MENKNVVSGMSLPDFVIKNTYVIRDILKYILHFDLYTMSLLLHSVK